MAPKKQNNKQPKKVEDPDCSSKAAKLLEMEVNESEPTPLADTAQATEVEPSESKTCEDTVTTTGSKSRGPRGVCAMHKILVKKARGKKIKVTCDAQGVPNGDSRSKLQSYIGMLARTMVPIDIDSWPEVDSELKDKIWLDVQDTFNIKEHLQNSVLQSAGKKWRQFKSDLTREYVMPFIGQKKKLSRPPNKYDFVGKGAWKRFVAKRTAADWQKLHEDQSNRVAKRKYPHRLSRKGYIGLKEEEVKLGRIEAGEDPDRAILWKKARIPKKGSIGQEQEEVNKKIDELLEKKDKGEFKTFGMRDVLTAALETPEHSGRVRAVGGSITPRAFFNLPRVKGCRITKADLLARDIQWSEDLEKATADLKSEIAELKALFSSAEANRHSPILSDKASFHPVEYKVKPPAAKELIVDEDIKEPTPPSGKQVPRKCDLSVGSPENKVAFGYVIPYEGESSKIHGREKPAGCLRVSVDGFSKADALLPVPVPGELETVIQALGSHVAWPEELISYPTENVVAKKKALHNSNKDDLQKLKTLFSGAEPSVNVPKGFRLLYKHATSYMQTTGSSIQIPCDLEVFGHEKTIFLLHENVLSLLEYEMIGQAVITTYMLHLHTELSNAQNIEKFAFCDPGFSFRLNTDFETYIVNRLSQGDAGRIFFLPHNHNNHWILSIIWEDNIFILNPMSHPVRFPALETALSRAVSSFNLKIGRSGHMPKVKNLTGSPKQPGGHECGYVVMRYMKDITQDESLSFVQKWSNKTRMSYDEADLHEVRCEVLEFIQSHV